MCVPGGEEHVEGEDHDALMTVSIDDKLAILAEPELVALHMRRIKVSVHTSSSC